MKGLYAFLCPLAKYTGNVDSKVGITGSWFSRIISNQSAYSKRNHIAGFDLVYVGPDLAVEKLEATIKARYNWAIASERGGETEWLTNHSVADIEKIIDQLIESFGYKIAKVDTQWLPLTLDKLEDFLEHYKSN